LRHADHLVFFRIAGINKTNFPGHSSMKKHRIFRALPRLRPLVKRADKVEHDYFAGGQTMQGLGLSFAKRNLCPDLGWAIYERAIVILL